MSSFNIIQLSVFPLRKNEAIENADVFDDPLVNLRSDYMHDDDSPLRGERLRQGIRRLGPMLAPIAVVDSDKGTLTFKSRAVVSSAYARHIRKAAEEHVHQAILGKPDQCSFRRTVDDACGIDDLFHMRCALTASQLISNYLNGWLPQTLHFGNILTAHC